MVISASIRKLSLGGGIGQTSSLLFLEAAAGSRTRDRLVIRTSADTLDRVRIEFLDVE
jgi:hypothetical protein